jgi:hypothetical protein
VTLSDVLAGLAEPLPPSPYCNDRRQIWDRLDAVLGRQYWCDDYHAVGPFVACRLRVEFGDKQSIVRVGCAPTPDEAFQAAAEKLGIGRDGVVPVEPPETKFAETAPPARPAPDLRTREDVPTPSTGRALYKWAKDCEAAHGWAVVKYLNDWAKLQGGWPGKMVEWSPQQVKAAHAEVLRKKPDMAPAAVDKESDDPLGIASDDTLNGLKMFVRAAALQFARRRLGLSDREHPGGREVIAEINRVAGSDGTIRSLADCSNALLLKIILDRFNVETEALHAVKG